MSTARDRTDCNSTGICIDYCHPDKEKRNDTDNPWVWKCPVCTKGTRFTNDREAALDMVTLTGLRVCTSALGDTVPFLSKDMDPEDVYGMLMGKRRVDFDHTPAQVPL